MPQMSPLWWSLMMIYTLLILFLMLTLIYYWMLYKELLIKCEVCPKSYMKWMW